MPLTVQNETIYKQKGFRDSSLTTICILVNQKTSIAVKTLESIHSQTVQNLDILIIGHRADESTLQTALTWITEFSSRFNRVELLAYPKIDEDTFKDIALSLSETPYIFFLKEDCFIYPRCIEVCENCLRDNPDVSFAYPIAKARETRTLIDNIISKEVKLKKWRNIPSTTLIRSSSFLQRQACHDLAAADDTYSFNHNGANNSNELTFEPHSIYGVKIPEILAISHSPLNSSERDEHINNISVIESEYHRYFHTAYPGEIEEVSANTVMGWYVNTNKELSSQKLCLRVDGENASTEAVVIPSPRVSKIQTKAIVDEVTWFTIRLPDQYLDGNSHRIEVVTKKGQALGPPITSKFELKYNLDVMTTSRVAGWISDLSSDFPVSLDLFINGRKETSFTANLERKDVGETARCGFDVTFTTQLYGHQSIEIRLKGSQYQLFDTPTVLLSNSGVVSALQKMSAAISACSDTFSAVEKQWLLEHLAPELIQKFREAGQIGTQARFDCRSTQRISPKNSPVRISDIVDVVIPVYKNFEVTKHCIQQAVTAKNKTRFNIIVIDDKGPEPEIQNYLSQIYELGQIELLVNSENEGFVRSVNKGMSLHGDRDVVLLNSDAIVQDYWLDRLYASAYASSNIASATPLSNHASIFSYPRICKEVGTLPEDVTPILLDTLCAELNQQQSSIDVPSMHGFCCFIKRMALETIGLFDAEKWGKGYGEEVDWSQKAASQGWRHVAAPNVFVEHVGSQSFTVKKDESIKKALAKLAAEYPDFDSRVQDFIRRDPLAICRRRLDLARAKQLCDRYMLFVSHGMGGGVGRHIQELAQQLKKEGIYTLILKPLHNHWVTLSAADDSLDFEAKYNLHRVEEFQTLVDHLKHVGIRHVHIHSTIGYADDHYIWDLPERIGVDYDITVHDYQAICPRVNLANRKGQYCGEPSDEQCDRCIAANGTYPNPAIEQQQRELKTVSAWRQYFHTRFQSARAVFAPSEDAAKRIEHYFDLSNLRFKPHPETQLEIELHSPNRDGPITVAIIGAISDIKGYQHLYECVTQAKALNYPLRFIIFGYTKNDHLFTDLDNIQITGPYSNSDELRQHLANHPCDIAAFLSTWPETYSYTLSEALTLGLVPVGFNIGAFPDRVSNVNSAVSLALDATTDQILDSFIAAGKNARTNTFQGFLSQAKSYGEISADYYQIKELFRKDKLED